METLEKERKAFLEDLIKPTYQKADKIKEELITRDYKIKKEYHKPTIYRNESLVGIKF